MSNDEYIESQKAMLAMIESGRFPMLARLAEHPEVGPDFDTIFEFGLKVFLDGLAVLIEGRTPGERHGQSSPDLS